MQRIFTSFLALTLCLLAACGGSGEPERNPASGPPTGNETEAPGITFTTFRYLPQEREVVEDFEKRFRTKVNVRVLHPRDIVLRARDNQLNGDIVLVPTLEDIVRLKNFGRLQPFFIDVFSQGNVDEAYQDNEGYYSGLTRWTMAVVYDPKSVAVDEVTTYKALAKLPSRGIKLGMAHPDSSGLAATVAGLSRVINQDAARLWTQIMFANTTGAPSGGDADQLDRMLAGELQVAFVSSGAAIRWFLNGDPLHFQAAEAWRIRYPHTETDQVNFLNMTSVGVLANAPNREMALRFVNHLYQKENQEKLGSATFEYPTEAFSEIDQYLLGVPDVPGRQIGANTLEDYIPEAWTIINQTGGNR